MELWFNKLMAFMPESWQKKQAESNGSGMSFMVPFIAVYLLVTSGLGIYWSQEPDVFVIPQAQTAEGKTLIGYATTATIVQLSETMLHKPGSYITNNIFPPGVFLDNMPAWEFGVLTQIRDITLYMRQDFARSQSQSSEDMDLALAHPQYNFSNDSWAIPATEDEYARGQKHLEAFLSRLQKTEHSGAQFYARADNLSRWLSEVERRLGSLSLNLSKSVGRRQLNTGLAGDSEARQSTPSTKESWDQTSLFKVDDVFYEARGASWALIHLLKAIEIDFAAVLEKKNALVSLQQIIRELEATQEAVWSPVIVNGSGFGLLANHSLVMANYISRANAAIIDLQRLLENG